MQGWDQVEHSNVWFLITWMFVHCKILRDHDKRWINKDSQRRNQWIFKARIWSKSLGNFSIFPTTRIPNFTCENSGKTKMRRTEQKESSKLFEIRFFHGWNNFELECGKPRSYLCKSWVHKLKFTCALPWSTDLVTLDAISNEQNILCISVYFIEKKRK